MKCFAITHPGLVRSGNEDSCFIPESGERFAIVCDGMGGHRAGEVASCAAVEALRRELTGAQPSPETLRAAILNVNRAVYDMAQADGACAGMGTTLTVLWWGDDKVLMGHVGDSRLYRYAGGELKQLTHDHTYVQELVDFGEITQSQARVHPRRNLITRAIGTRPSVEVDTAGFERAQGTAYLLCSDGLTNMLEDEQILDILNRNAPERALSELLEGALAHGGTDNITAILALDEEVGS